jgi:hypothetical protein
MTLPPTHCFRFGYRSDDCYWCVLLHGEKAFLVPISGMIRYLAATLVLGVVAACASGGAGAAPMSDSTAARPASARRSSTVITEEEIAKVSARDGYHAVQLLRPDWFRVRGASSLSGQTSEAVVYMNGQRLGGLRSLTQIQATGIKDMRFLSAAEATNRYGTGHEAGAILVTTK